MIACGVSMTTTATGWASAMALEPLAGEPRLLLAAAHRGQHAAAVADLQEQEPDQQEADEEAGDDQPGKCREFALERAQILDRAAASKSSTWLAISLTLGAAPASAARIGA